MKLLLLTALLFSVGVGQTKQDSVHNTLDCVRLQEMRRLQKIVALKAASQRAADRVGGTHFVVGTDSRIVLGEDFWLAFAAKVKEYETWCAESVYVPTGVWSVDRERMKREPLGKDSAWVLSFWSKPDSAWRQQSYPTLPGFRLWLERKKQKGME